MTINEFRGHLQDLDSRYGTSDCKMFECEVSQVGENYFYYSFDALMGVFTRFHDSGMVEEWTDCGEKPSGDPINVWPNVEAWKEGILNTLKENER